MVKPEIPKCVVHSTFSIAAADAAQRIDLFLSGRLPQLSRAQIQRLIKSTDIRLNAAGTVPRQRLQAGDVITVYTPESRVATGRPENLPLSIIHEDTDLMVIDKAPGMAVHPAPGTEHGTLVNALRHYGGELSSINGELRPGIVHRLDKDTSGLLLVARNNRTHLHLVAQLRSRSINRCYTALVWGNLVGQRGTIDAALGRNPRNRSRISVVKDGRRAVTHFAVARRFPYLTLLNLNIETGRTHQIRVHLLHRGHPVFGDPVYGGRTQTQGIKPEYRQHARYLLSLLKRQALHARELHFKHPSTGEKMVFAAEFPKDLATVVEAAGTI